MEGHPERAERISFVVSHLQQCGLGQDVDWQTPRAATVEEIALAHTTDHIYHVTNAQPTEGVIQLDPDTWMGTASLDAAQFAAGAVCTAVEQVLAGHDTRAFCAMRPPGHHAEQDAALGFCIFNSIAVGAMLALQDDKIERIAILDFDVHHGNGTVDIFRDNPQVLVCSSFQHPFYPHRFFESDWRNIVNTPLDSGSGGAEFRDAIARDWVPAIHAHKPDLILVSAGFDGHQQDPLAQLNLLETDYQWVTQLIVELAHRYAQGRVISVLEGGYDLNALALSTEAHLTALAEL